MATKAKVIKKAVPKIDKVKPYGVSVGQDTNGFYVYTHRARSKSYASQDKIPVKDLKFIDSTG